MSIIFKRSLKSKLKYYLEILELDLGYENPEWAWISGFRPEI